MQCTSAQGFRGTHTIVRYFRAQLENLFPLFLPALLKNRTTCQPDRVCRGLIFGSLRAALRAKRSTHAKPLLHTGAREPVVTLCVTCNVVPAHVDGPRGHFAFSPYNFRFTSLCLYCSKSSYLAQTIVWNWKFIPHTHTLKHTVDLGTSANLKRAICLRTLAKVFGPCLVHTKKNRSRHLIATAMHCFTRSLWILRDWSI